MPRGEFDRAERKARTREQLLAAAAQVYARCGFDGATLDEVAEEAGFTKGAVYDHFGSKENLLIALLDEHLSVQIAEQIALFDVATAGVERPRVGAERWIAELEEDPDAFRLFVELWVHAQRDDQLRERVAHGLQAWRATLQGFARTMSERSGIDAPEGALEQVANVVLALSTGLAMIKLIDPESVSPRLLGAALVLLIRAVECSGEARALLGEVALAPQSPGP